MQHKKLAIIFFSIALLFIIIIIILIMLTLKGEKSTQEVTTKISPKTEDMLYSLLSSQTGGTIIKNGFEISSLETEQTFVIKITRDPFQGNLTKAKEYLNDRGIELNQTHYICSISRGVNASQEEVEKCGNSLIK